MRIPCALALLTLSACDQLQSLNTCSNAQKAVHAAALASTAASIAYAAKPSVDLHQAATLAADALTVAQQQADLICPAT